MDLNLHHEVVSGLLMHYSHAWGVSEEFLTAAAYVGGPVFCEDSLGFTDRTLSSCGVAGIGGVPGPGGVVPGGVGGGEDGGEAAPWF